jgi:WD40 repeat protein
MAGPVPPPIFTFRGHEVGVTALVYRPPSTLYSGDQEGNIMSWDLNTFKRTSTWKRVCCSKIMSLKIVQLKLGTVSSDLLVIQSRSDGVHLNMLDSLENITKFPTYESLFSRGDALTLQEQGKVILAYPSSIESHLVTVRYLGDDAKTLISGSARRQDEDKRRRETAVFDIQVKSNGTDDYILVAAYEDGCINMYCFNEGSTETVSELNVTGLKIIPLRKLDFGLQDFVSAFDVIDMGCDRFVIVCGSPKKELIFSNCPKSSDDKDDEINIVTLEKPGVSVVSIRPDHKLVAAACWDNKIRVLSLRTRRHLATIKNHMQQVSAIVFVEKIMNKQHLMCCSSLDGTISVFDIFN